VHIEVAEPRPHPAKNSELARRTAVNRIARTS
jgi:hypothetical protein